MRKKAYLLLTLLGVILLILTISIYTNLLPFPNLELKTWLMIASAAITSILALILTITKLQELKRGEPLTDERTKTIALRTGNTTAIITLYWLLFLSVFTQDGTLLGMDVTISETLGLAMMGMTLIYGISYLFHRGRND